jgi:hypothetical protein
MRPFRKNAHKARQVRLEMTQLEDRTVPSALAVEIPGSGVWRYIDYGGWTHLTSANASLVAVAHIGDVLAEFPGHGVRRYQDWTG